MKQKNAGLMPGKNELIGFSHGDTLYKKEYTICITDINISQV